MPRLKSVPSYCLHKPSGRARIILDGRQIYLGVYGSPESRKRYARLIAERFRPGRIETGGAAVSSAPMAWFSGTAEVKTYELNELLGTKLRALYQRRKSRDLFDRWLCIDRKMMDPAQVVACFGKYMKHEGHSVSRAQLEENLHRKESDREFMDDIKSLLNPAVSYDPVEAMKAVRKVLIERIVGEPWRGKEQ